jgi:prepilin-type N-terminal cleavage/methylation domain-containing protein
MRQRGFTFIEILIVMILIGIIAAIGIPRLRNSLQKTNVRSARAALSTIVSKARAAAVQRGCTAALHFTSGSSGKVWITLCKVNAAGVDTLGGVEPIAGRFNVTFTASRDSVRFMPNGILLDNVSTTLRVTWSTITDSIMINSVGKVVR